MAMVGLLPSKAIFLNTNLFHLNFKSCALLLRGCVLNQIYQYINQHIINLCPALSCNTKKTSFEEKNSLFILLSPN